VQLLPALSLETKIVSIKEIQEGEPVGYNMGYVANKKMKLATIPLGYFEGLDKRLSNIGLVKVQDKYCKIVGKVSMNMSMIDVSEVDYPKINDKVEVISPNTESPNSIKNIASLVNTNQAEILVHINPQLGRIVI
jgi:alanine racemase